jgi:alpha-1,3-rhamnosyl/mannosyltransferase
MRVLLDCRMATWSGIGRYSTGLARSLARIEGVQIVQIVEEGESAPVPEAESVEARIHPFYPTAGIELGRIVTRARPDITHCLHVPTPLPARHPLVVTIHDLTPFVVPAVMPSAARRAAYRWWNARAARQADRLIAISQATADDISRYYPQTAGRVRVVLEAADDFGLEEQVRLSPELVSDGSPYLLSMGNVKPHKDLPTLLRAFAVLHPAHPHVRLLLVGRETVGYAASVLGDTAAASLVSFTGRVDDATLRALYAGAMAFVFPSRYEGFGLPPLEAMISGTPVVCADAASLPEVVGDAGLLFPAGDAVACARQIERVIDDEVLREALVAAGAGRARLFTWQRTAEATLAVYHEVLDKPEPKLRNEV